MAGNDVKTLLLLHGEDLTDASQYARVLTNSGVTVSDAQSKFGGKSLYFNGSAYLTISDINLLPATGDFTVDWWEYRTASSEGSVVFHQPVKAKDGTGTIFGYGYQNAVNVYMGNVSGSFNIAGQTSMGAEVLNQWVHRAVVRSGSTFYLFADGALQNTITSSAALARNVTPYIGRYDSGNYLYYKGYINEFRVSEGARWTENFTPPTEAEDIPWGGNDDHTLLLLHGEDLTDASLNAVTLENDETVVSEAQSKFGGKSLYFNGQAKILLDAIDFGAGDFTVDWWEYVASSASSARFCTQYTTETANIKLGGILLGFAGTAVYASSYISTGAWDLISGANMFSNTLNTWVHWAAVRSGATFTTYRNGVKFATTNISGAIVCDEQYKTVIGDYRAGDEEPFIGYLDEFRISDIARWTADFVPPSKPYESPAAAPIPPKALAFVRDGNMVLLQWTPSAQANVYHIYRDFARIATAQAAEYTDAGIVSPAAYVYSVTAENQYGESEHSDTARVEYWGEVAPDLIYDRTMADVNEAKSLIIKYMSGENLTESERELWNAGLRGCYNTSDVNRVEYHTRELQSILNAEGYNIQIDAALWARSDIMRYGDIVKYLGNIEAILDAFGRSANAPPLPTIDQWINYIVANDIEKILFVTRELIYGALAMFRRAGTFTAGNDYHAQIIRRA